MTYTKSEIAWQIAYWTRLLADDGAAPDWQVAARRRCLAMWEARA